MRASFETRERHEPVDGASSPEVAGFITHSRPHTPLQQPSTSQVQQTARHQERKGWRKTLTNSKCTLTTTTNTNTSQPSPEAASLANRDCIIELGSALDTSQPRTSLISDAAATGSTGPPTGQPKNGSLIHIWFRGIVAKYFKSSMHRLARRLSWIMGKLESPMAQTVPLPTGSRYLAATYSIYQTALAAESFKHAIGLFLFLSCVLFFHLIQSNVIQHLTVWLLLYLPLVGLGGYYYMSLFRRAAKARLAENGLLKDACEQERRNPIHFRRSLSNSHILDSIHFLVLNLTAIWAVIGIFLDPQLGPIMAIIIYIFYTHLAILHRRLVVLVCLLANLLALLPLGRHHGHQEPSTNNTSGQQNRDAKTTLELQFQLVSSIFVSLIAFAVFHVQGFRLHRHFSRQCLKSFNLVMGYEKAEIQRKAEDKKLTALLERAYPKDIVGEIRKYKLNPLELEERFQPFFTQFYDSVSILYADIVNFTNISSGCKPHELVQVLHELVGRFDREADKYPCLRIKILGDCYYCVSGIPKKEDNNRHAQDCVEMALDMIDILDDMADMGEMVNRFDLKMRVGIHSGRVICGVLGSRRKQFDVYSDDVRLANLLEQSGRPGKIHISERTLKALNNSYQVEVAHDNLRSIYNHLQEDVKTYFVKPPANRPKPNSILATNTKLGPTKTRLNFKAAATRVQNVLRFKRTIEAPFTNLVEGSSSRSDSMSDASSVMGSSLVCATSSPTELRPKPRVRVEEADLRITIESRCLADQSSDVDPLTLRFNKDEPTYKTSYPYGRLLSLAISIVALFLLTLVYKRVDPLSRVSISQYNLENLLKSLVYVIVYLVTSLVHWHQQEFLARRDFMWAKVASEDKKQLWKLQDCNRSIFYDLLPRHVIPFFLDQQGARSHEDLYCKSYTCVGVLFANICNYYQYYDEKLNNRNGLECLRVLNEIICDFDALLEEERFKSIDKIKTIGATYMAAIGLLPDHKMPEYRVRRSSTVFVDGAESTTNTSNTDPEPSLEIKRQAAAAMRTLAMFVFEMRNRLDEIQEHSFFPFKLRAGINMGPVTAGVIAASKPQYDIWGNTVNVASRMESKAESGKLQITEGVYELLEKFNEEPEFEFTYRGPQEIKGKGLMKTYYLELKSRPQASGGTGGGSLRLA